MNLCNICVCPPPPLRATLKQYTQCREKEEGNIRKLWLMSTSAGLWQKIVEHTSGIHTQACSGLMDCLAVSS